MCIESEPLQSDHQPLWMQQCHATRLAGISRQPLNDGPACREQPSGDALHDPTTSLIQTPYLMGRSRSQAEPGGTQMTFSFSSGSPAGVSTSRRRACGAAFPMEVHVQYAVFRHQDCLARARDSARYRPGCQAARWWRSEDTSPAGASFRASRR